MSIAGDDDKDLLHEMGDDGIGVVTFNRPVARNALTFGMYERLAEICRTIPADGSLQALIITGRGDKAFAAGTDISLFREFTGGDDGIAYEARMEKVMGAIEHCAVPTIAAIHGACTGGGAVIAAVCDIRIASKDLKFGFPIARTLGNCLSSENLARLNALIGMARTKDLIFTSRLMGSDEALMSGLISEICEDRETCLRRAKDVALAMAEHAPLTMRATKELLIRMRSGDMADSDLIALCYGSDDFHEGLEAFLAKRAPKWRGH